MKTRTVTRLLFSLALAASLTLPTATPALAATNTTAKVTTRAAHTAHTGLNEIHSQAEIREKLNAPGIAQLDEKIVYSKKPTFHKPYSLDQIGAVSKTTQQHAIDQINQYRWLAGLGQDRMLTVNNDNIPYAQAAAYYLAVRDNGLSHHPEKIANTTQELYDQAAIGTACSNLGMDDTLNLGGYIQENGGLEIGHRIEFLAEYSDTAAYGKAPSCTNRNDYNGYSACMISGMSTLGKMKNAGVAWPTYNTPLEYVFSNYDEAEYLDSGEEVQDGDSDFAWSFSSGDSALAKNKSAVSKIQVIFTNFQTGKKEVFSKTSNADNFTIEDDAVVWIPSNVIYKSGYSFHVTITGLDYPVDYDVNFFRLRTKGTNKPSDQTSGTKESGSKAAAAKLKSRTVKKPQTKKTSYKSGKTFRLPKSLISGSGETYASSDKKIATVSKSGKVTIKKPGYVKISVKSRKTKTYKAASTSVKLYVYPGKVKSVKVKRSGRHGCKVSWKTAKSLYSDVDIVCAASKRKLKRMTKHASKSSARGDLYNAKRKKATYRSRKSKRRTYYFCVRSCKTSHGKELYGSWSKVYKVRF